MKKDSSNLPPSRVRLSVYTEITFASCGHRYLAGLTATRHRPGFDADEALHWSKVLLHHSPDPQRAGIKAQMSSAIARGIPVAGPDWVPTADSARADGFNPVLYQALFESVAHHPTVGIPIPSGPPTEEIQNLSARHTV